MKLLPPVPGETGDSSQHIISWYNYDPTAGLSLKQNTYHSFTGGWYLRLPTRLGTDLQIVRGAEMGGVAGLSFYTTDEEGNPESELFSVYTLTGSARNSITPADGRFVLSARGETTYAARLGSGARAVNLTKDEVTATFNYIQVNRFGGAA